MYRLLLILALVVFLAATFQARIGYLTDVRLGSLGLALLIAALLIDRRRNP